MSSKNRQAKANKDNQTRSKTGQQTSTISLEYKIILNTIQHRTQAMITNAGVEDRDINSPKAVAIRTTLPAQAGCSQRGINNGQRRLPDTSKRENPPTLSAYCP